MLPILRTKATTAQTLSPTKPLFKWWKKTPEVTYIPGITDFGTQGGLVFNSDVPQKVFAIRSTDGTFEPFSERRRLNRAIRLLRDCNNEVTLLNPDELWHVPDLQNTDHNAIVICRDTFGNDSELSLAKALTNDKISCGRIPIPVISHTETPIHPNYLGFRSTVAGALAKGIIDGCSVPGNYDLPVEKIES